MKTLTLAAGACSPRLGDSSATTQHVPARLQNAVARAVPLSVRDQVVKRSITGGHDWLRTPGFALAPLVGSNRWLPHDIRDRISTL